MRIEPRQRQARLGDGEVALQGLGGDQARMDDHLPGQEGRDLGVGLVDGDRHGAQAARGQHHDRPARALHGRLGGQFAEKFGMAGKLEARLIEGRLGDGGGDHGLHGARQGQAHRRLDPGNDLGGVGAGRLAGDDPHAQRNVEHGQGVGEHSASLARRADPGQDRFALGRGGRQDFMIADNDEGRARHAQGLPGLEHHFGADAGRVAQAQGQGPGGGARHRVSMSAEFLRSRK